MQRRSASFVTEEASPGADTMTDVAHRRVAGSRFVLDPSSRVWSSTAVIAGGSPWRLSRLRGDAIELVRLLAANRETGVELTDGELVVAHALVDRGLVHPRPDPRSGPHEVTVIVPAYGRPDSLRRTLAALTGLDVLVVDDGSPAPLVDVAREAGARYLRLEVNAGPAAARNAGLAATSTPLVALVDSDCVPERSWLDRLVPLFDDARVAVVAPRVIAVAGDQGLLARYERASSALDMGSRQALVRAGARLGFVPSVTLLVRRDAVIAEPFDQTLRLGEDVDLVWRIADTGAHVRFEPSVVVEHELRGSWRAWAVRRYEYGTSAVLLERRHPGRLAPLRVSPWNAAAVCLVAAGEPVLAVGVAALAAGLLARRLAGAGLERGVAERVVGAGLIADGAAIGHALRREYWPLGAAALACAPRSRAARVATVLMVAPLLAEWAREKPALDPLRYMGVRLVADAAYGTGVLRACLGERDVAALRPRLRGKFTAASRGVMVRRTDAADRRTRLGVG